MDGICALDGAATVFPHSCPRHSQPSADSWPTFLYDARYIAQAPDPGPRIGVRQCRCRAGGGISSPVVSSDGTIYAGLGDNLLPADRPHAVSSAGALHLSYTAGESVRTAGAIEGHAGPQGELTYGWQ